HPRVLDLLKPALRREPAHAAWRSLQATAYAGVGDFARAMPIYGELIAAGPLPAAPPLADLHLAFGHALKTLGRASEAVASYRAAASAPRAIGEAFWALADLKSYRFTDTELEQMRRELERADGSFTAQYHLCFALGKALEDRREWGESFAYYERGNRLKRSQTGYRPERIEKTAAELTALCTREFFAARPGYGNGSTAPIFVVGLPRSGSTLVEQILASHSEVDGTLELPHVLRLVQDLAATSDGSAGGGTAYPAVLAQLNGTACRRHGERLLAETQPYRGDRRYYVDKMPNNFLHLGLIHLILPNARIIDVRRGPMAACFAIYKQLFAAGQEFAYDFADIARYYRMYEALMAHWDEALPGKVLRVEYERLVDDLPGTVRTMLGFCGLEYQAACLEFQTTPRPVHSASAEQVRQPLHRNGIDHWRHYAPWLTPLTRALGVPDSV
ncbi:MAG TPA: sulfotransferase, partial [Steroidobacteraceae bacterium]|nr:sulfotransferase [Steroidobacteraceae bacterium]